jgi:hypothetical protein
MHSVENINQIPDRIRRLGVYKYNNRYYSNKFRALTDAGKNYINWIFNDEEYSKHNFLIEPSEDLYELYAKRAWQIRQKYDKVVIYFSGGIDSTTVLRSFVDNNVPIDAVVIYGAWGATSTRYGKLNVVEQEVVGLAYLKHVEKEKGIKLNVHLLDTTEYYQRYNEDWAYNNSYNINPAISVFSYFDEDPFFQNLMMQGSVCTVRGVDKPRLIFEDGAWKTAFLDVTLGGVTSFSNYQDRKYYLLDEFFFWTPDMPEIVAKQSHMIAQELERRFTPEQCAKKFTRLSKFDKISYGELVEPVIYGRYVKQEIGQARPYFYMPPAKFGIINERNYWFFNAKDKLSNSNDLFVEGVVKLKQTIDPMHFNKVPNNQVLIDDLHKKISIDQKLILTKDTRDPLVGTVGCWSPDYVIKPYFQKGD